MYFSTLEFWHMQQSSRDLISEEANATNHSTEPSSKSL